MDDNIRFLKEITEKGYQSIFEHPYLATYRRLHEEFDLKIQLNLFYRLDNFDLSMMSDAYCKEWAENADWLKLSFHSELENVNPYALSGYDAVYADCKRVHEQIIRFASPESLATTTTVHCCLTTKDGLRAMAANGVKGLLGLFGTQEKPRTSYGIEESDAARIRNGEILQIGNISFAAIDIILNCFSTEEILQQLARMRQREGIRVMIHEQYFYADYYMYQPEFEQKLRATFAYLRENDYQSSFFEDDSAELLHF